MLVRKPIIILPPFFHFSHSHALICPQLPTPPTHVPPLCAFKLWDSSSLTVYCTHVHYPICPCSYLVPYSCAEASYHIPLTHSSLTHLSPFSTIQLSHLVYFLTPIYIIDTSHFTFIRGLMLLSLIPHYT